MCRTMGASSSGPFRLPVSWNLGVPLPRNWDIREPLVLAFERLRRGQGGGQSDVVVARLCFRGRGTARSGDCGCSAIFWCLEHDAFKLVPQSAGVDVKVCQNSTFQGVGLLEHPFACVGDGNVLAATVPGGMSAIYVALGLEFVQCRAQGLASHVDNFCKGGLREGAGGRHGIEGDHCRVRQSQAAKLFVPSLLDKPGSSREQTAGRPSFYIRHPRVRN